MADNLVEEISAKSAALPLDRQREVLDFVEFLWQRSVKHDGEGSRNDTGAQLKSIAESMMANTFTGDPPRFSREDLHERR